VGVHLPQHHPGHADADADEEQQPAGFSKTASRSSSSACLGHAAIDPARLFLNEVGPQPVLLGMRDGTNVPGQ
jgi:hypothetical protein